MLETLSKPVIAIPTAIVLIWIAALSIVALAYFIKPHLFWHLKQKKHFNAWKAEQDNRIKLMTKMGVSYPLACATVMRDAIVIYDELSVRLGFNPKRDRYFKALAAWLTDKVTLLQALSLSEKYSVVDRVAALKSVADFMINESSRGFDPWTHS